MVAESCKVVAKRDRLAVAIQMYGEGATMKVIGKHLGISHQAVSKMLRDEKRRITAELEGKRNARARKSEERFDVVKETEELVRLHVEAAKEDPTDKGTGGMAYTGVRLLAQLRGELIEKRENRNRNSEERDIDLPLFEQLMEKYQNNGN